MENYLIIADDFTGANDTGVQLRRRGIPVSVVFSCDLIAGEESCVLDTESRGIPAEAAYRKVEAEVKNIDFGKFTHVMKKIDSTLRGNAGPETKALDNKFKAELVIFAPALPDLGRTTVNRIQHLNGKPLSQTELIRDPKTPVKEDNIQKLFAASFLGENVFHIEIGSIQNNTINFEGSRIFTCDAEKNEDLRKIISAALATKKRTLWVGTAAMADNLLSITQTIPPALAMVASLSSVTRNQVQYAEKQGVSLVKIALYDILEQSVCIEDIAAKAVSFLREGRDTIVLSSSTYSAEEYEKAESAAKRAGLSREQMSAFTEKTMGCLSMLILKKVRISGLFLAGGDTAMAFFEKAGSKGSSIVTEIALGIPLMRLRGGIHEGLKVVTKAGAFGKEDAIFYALHKLREVDT
ncbi:MAG: four-carbon acid sugar kinase family protein [Treponema sp.]|jgi:uncharacterized protein YgbK (DUF1537 family)|nr:four-carbon acid sugar kinase family protein [Treponema sp.]